VDITLRKEAEDAMRRAREHAEAAAKAKGSFLAHMSHEIRSPLNAVLGYAQLLARDTSLTPKQSGRVERILRAGDHLLSLVNQVLDMSVIESGHLDVVLGPVEPKALVDEVVEMFEPRAAKAGIRLSRNVAKEVPSTVLADAGKVRQILINVVGNAVRVTTNGGVDVEVVLDKHTDRGPSTARGSAGLGLAISRRYADLMGGSLSFTPRSSGGTTFELVLPLEEPRATAQEAVLPRGEEATLGPSDGTPSRKPSVVLIDDEEDNCDVLRETLENEGFLVATAASGEEGLSLVRHVHPDAVVVDQRMPGMDGLTTVERMRSDTPPFQGPILMLSASIFEGLDQQAIQAGANAYMAKPVQQSELVQRVRDLLRSKVSEERPGVEA
jgi:CheY-like chemotaxis protein